MKYTKEELQWIKKHTSKRELSDTKKYLSKKQPKAKKKKSQSFKMTPPKKDSDLYKWAVWCRDRLIKKQTQSERDFYESLDILNIPYDKQYPFFINKRVFFADAVFHETHTIVEIDGGYHKKKSILKYDANRTKHLNGVGYRVVRITNEEVSDVALFMSKISKFLPIDVPAYMYLV